MRSPPSVKLVNWNDWFPTKNSVLCIKHFLWKIYFERKAKQTQLGFTSNSYDPFRKNKKTVSFADNNRLRKSRKFQWIIHQPDELQDFISADTRKDFNHLEEEKFCLNSFKQKNPENYILIYRIIFEPETLFPSIKECICIDWNLHIQLQCEGNPISLPQSFIHEHNVKLKRFSMLENFPNYMQNVVEEQQYPILKELLKRQH